jgi:UDP-glucose 4-epimerase
MTHKVVLVTGVAGYWGSQVAARLVTEPGLHVLGLDANPPQEGIEGLEFIQADVRNPLLAELFQTEKVDTVCHLNFVPSTRPREVTFDTNLMGTMKVFGACVQAGVRKIVLKSSTAVYGAHPHNPAFLTEAHPLRGSRRYGYVRDLVEIEAFCNGFRRQSPGTALTVLRFASVVGPTADTPMTRFLKGRWSPVLLGFDPLMQLIHQDDVVQTLVHAVVNDVPGVFNVAAGDPMPLRRIMGLAGKLPLPVLHLLAYRGVTLLGGTRLPLARYVPMDLDYLRYRWVGDLTKMHDELGFAPLYTAEEALREFAGQRRIHRYTPQAAALTFDEERLRDTIERRRRAQERQESTVTAQEAEA